MGLQAQLFIGNLNALRDRGHARDYIKAQWLILQHDRPDDFVVTTGVQHSVREFCEVSFEALGIMIEWKGSGVDEIGVVAGIRSDKMPEKYLKFSKINKLEPGTILVSVDPRYFRPTEVESLLGDPGKTRDHLGWTPETSVEDMVREMTAYDLEEAARDALNRKNGFHIPNSFEAGM